jgi:hypothetical protein
MAKFDNISDPNEESTVKPTVVVNDAVIAGINPSQSTVCNIVEEHWIKSYWRPAMGWLYMCICFTDFVVFPLMTMVLPILFKRNGIVDNYQAWVSLTLSNGGIIHLAFGAILGVTAWCRSQEKLLGSK